MKDEKDTQNKMTRPASETSLTSPKTSPKISLTDDYYCSNLEVNSLIDK